MGLTFTQKFYQVPKVYIIRFSVIGDLADAQAIAGFIPIPEDKDLDSKLHMEFEAAGYWLDPTELHDIAVNGFDILRELGITTDYFYEE